MTLNEWFWKRGPVYLMTCRRYPGRRDHARREMDRIGVDYVESYDDGTVAPEVRHHSASCSRCSAVYDTAFRTYSASSRGTGGMWCVEDDVAFLNDVGELAAACMTLPVVADGYGVNLGANMKREGRHLAPLEIINGGTVVGIPFVWCAYHQDLAFQCRFIPDSIIEWWLSSFSFRPGDSLSRPGANDVAIARRQQATGTRCWVSSVRLAVQTPKFENGVCRVGRLLRPRYYAPYRGFPACAPADAYCLD